MYFDSQGHCLEVRAYNNPSRRGVEFFICDVAKDTIDDRSFATLTDGWTVIADNAMPPAAFSLDAHHAQFLMDSLWDCGLRPSEGKGSAGQLAAVENHLNDMRALVFDTFEVAPPNPKR